MPTPIFRQELQRLLEEEDAQLVEVLPRQSYNQQHLPGAVNIPLKGLDADAAGVLDPARPVVLYCYDAL